QQVANMPVAGAFSCPARYLAPKAPADRASDHAKGGAGLRTTPPFPWLMPERFLPSRIGNVRGHYPSRPRLLCSASAGRFFLEPTPAPRISLVRKQRLVASKSVASKGELPRDW